MSRIFKQCTACLLAIRCLMALPITHPAHAVDEADAAPVVLNSQYELERTAGAFTIQINESLANAKIHLCIEKLTPEGNFRYYDTDLSGRQTSGYTGVLEPGDYAITVQVTTLDFGGKYAVFSEKYTLANPDFDETLTETQLLYSLSRSLETEGWDNTSLLQSKVSEETQDGILTRATTMQTRKIPGVLGDNTDDGQVNAADAVLCLKDYSDAMLKVPSKLTLAQQCRSDVNSSGTVDTYDAILMLKYYAGGLVDETRSWAVYL